MAVYVIIRAAMLDQVEPWYEVTPPEPNSPEPLRALADRRRNRSAERSPPRKRANTSGQSGTGS